MSISAKAIALVLDHEGGYVNHPEDPGGETNYGISKRAYPSLDIRSLTREDAMDIYRRDYWTPIKGNQLPADVAIYLMDTAVNVGVSRAVKMLQKAVGVVQDGSIGPKTIQAVQGTPNALQLLDAARLAYYRRLPTFATFGRGWIRRAAETFRYAKDVTA
jgi:lysozyme family protein